jgi:hypothetical protein
MPSPQTHQPGPFTLPLVDSFSCSHQTRDRAAGLHCHGGASSLLGLAMSEGEPEKQRRVEPEVASPPQPKGMAARSRGTSIAGGPAGSSRPATEYNPYLSQFRYQATSL